jgi:hypothetical protein
VSRLSSRHVTRREDLRPPADTPEAPRTTPPVEPLPRGTLRIVGMGLPGKPNLFYGPTQR